MQSADSVQFSLGVLPLCAPLIRIWVECKRPSPAKKQLQAAGSRCMKATEKRFSEVPRDPWKWTWSGPW